MEARAGGSGAGPRELSIKALPEAPSSIPHSLGPTQLLSHLLSFSLILGKGAGKEVALLPPHGPSPGLNACPQLPELLPPDLNPSGLPLVTCPGASLSWVPPLLLLGPECPRPGSFQSTALSVPTHPLSLLCRPPAQHCSSSPLVPPHPLGGLVFLGSRVVWWKEG